MKRYRYNINNLDCANCAREVEEELNKNKNLDNVVVNFSTSKISYDAKREISIEELNKLIKMVEPDAYVSMEELEQRNEYNVLVFFIAIVLGIIGCYVKLAFNFNLILVIVSYGLLLYRPFINAFKMLIKNKSINENMLIVISCVGALIVGETLEGMMVISLYTIGKILESKAINNTRKSIGNLMDIKQDYANRKGKNGDERIDVIDISIDDILIVKKGEKIPVDGVVVKGSSELDTSALTGEADLVGVNIDDRVLSGSINVGEVIEIKATNKYVDSTVFKILELVENATDKKANTETMVSRISRVYTPIVLVLAVLVAVFLPLISKVSFSESVYRGLVFLVISCPCAIAISVPLSYFTGIGVSSKNGILVKGSNYLDNLHKLRKIVFDKTGTLTTGYYQVRKIEIVDKNYKMDEIIEILVKGESLSNHPIAKSIIKYAGIEVDSSDVSDYKEIAGMGISYTYKKKKIMVGTRRICNCDYDDILHLNIDGSHVASIMIDDGIKENAKNVIDDLKKLGIKTYMFTGDKKEVANNIGKKLELDYIKYEMLPDNKYQEFMKIKMGDEIVSFVGDGINDAPTLKVADIGISMGGVGSQAAIEASDIVIMNDDLRKIILAIKISKYTNDIIKQNLIFAILVKIIILLLSVVGIGSMWFAVFADTGVTLLTILNTLRIFKKYGVNKN